ncbi:ATP-binding cassette domain-containing protein [Cereibacter sphaeroides]|uniref:ATP-binding cassette domain-containing protein n=1 Tax=Cereibacter sphaeroides TaxID=1063 RepID=UPI000B2224EB|nr:ATP-binding cassette domain-containing protein [Cereibacter sphaeroides]
MDKLLAELRSVSKSYAAVRVLKGVHFSVRAGEIHALLGGNGAGKSTLMKILAGLVAPSGGEVRLGGAPLVPATPAQAQAMGLYLVPQEAHIFPNQTVLQNIAVGMPKPAGPYPRGVEALIAQLGVSLSPDAKAATLEIADRQIVEILRGLLREAKVLILDEPTSALTPHEVRTLFGHMRALRAEGHGLVFISHKLHELRAVADRITVLRDGHVVFAEAMETSPDAEILAAMSPGVTALDAPRADARDCGGAGADARPAERRGLRRDLALAPAGRDPRADRRRGRRSDRACRDAGGPARARGRERHAGRP